MQLSEIDNNLIKKGLVLPEKAGKYLHVIIPFLKKYLKDDFRSIIIFGSIVKGYCSTTSDADILIIVSNRTPKNKIIQLHRILTSYEIKYEYMKPKSGLLSSILYCVDKSTGMFISHFISREKDFLSGKFARIFSVNRILAWFLAPNEIVYGSVLGRAITLYGEDLVKKVKLPNVSIFQLLKSAIMNILTSFGGLITGPLSEKATLYGMESFKWSLLASYYYVHHDSPNILEIIKYFKKHKICSKAIKTWTGLRKEYQQDVKFSLFAPLNIIRIHLAVISKPK